MQKRINKKHFRIAIFGSARIKKGHPVFNSVKKLATGMGDQGIDLVTGGGPGLMDAASFGHYKSKMGDKTDSIGLKIKLTKEKRTARHLDIIKDFSKFSARLDEFMELSNVVVVAPGGIGTLLEFLYTWQLVQVRHKKEIPIILMSEGMWYNLIEWIKKYPLKDRLISPEDMDPIFPVKNPEEAMKIITLAHKISIQGKTVSCKKLKQML